MVFMSNRKERRAGKKLVKKGKAVMFSIAAPVLHGITCISTEPVVYTAMRWTDPDPDKLGHRGLDSRILLHDKDIIRAIYYPDRILGIKETQIKFACALAESVNLWSQRLSAAQRPYFDQIGLHHLEITQADDETVQWHWEFNRNNRMSISTEVATLHGLSNLEIHPDAQPGDFPIWTKIGYPEVGNLLH
jgi:hypothetical protein